TDEAFRAPVADLLDPENRRTVRGPGWATPAFVVAGHVVWGFTALVLDRLFDELGWTEPWDRSREIPRP
ncbi:MAG: coenzyme A pyrophosphatase, partial [Actinomycetales bacterium]|nr:coenzyme A pyrophosphatase [Actinomycetales bacterium]